MSRLTIMLTLDFECLFNYRMAQTTEWLPAIVDYKYNYGTFLGIIGMFWSIIGRFWGN